MKLYLASEAIDQLEERMVWWDLNRPNARVSVDDAFYETMRLVLQNPYVGHIYEDDQRYRSIDLHRTMPYYALYYVNEPSQLIEVDSVWSRMQGDKPPLPFRPG